MSLNIPYVGLCLNIMGKISITKPKNICLYSSLCSNYKENSPELYECKQKLGQSSPSG
jgi:hypothetical protein